MGSSQFRRYPYPNPTGDGADVSYWAQRLADAVDVDMKATLDKITSAVATGVSNAGKIATNAAAITALRTRATALEKGAEGITTNRNSIAANLAKIVALTTRVGALETRTPFIMHTGRATITLPIGFSGNNVVVDFPGTDFTVAPNVTITMSANTSGDASKVIARHYDVTKSSFRVDIGTTDNRPSTALYSFSVHWIAVQMKAGSANG